MRLPMPHRLPASCGSLASFHPETALFRRGGVNPQACLCGVPMCASAKPLDFLATTKIARFPYENYAVSIRSFRMDTMCCRRPRKLFQSSAWKRPCRPNAGRVLGSMAKSSIATFVSTWQRPSPGQGIPRWRQSAYPILVSSSLNDLAWPRTGPNDMLPSSLETEPSASPMH